MKRIRFLLTVIIAFCWLYKTSDRKGLKRFTQSIKFAFIITAAILGMPLHLRLKRWVMPSLITPTHPLKRYKIQQYKEVGFRLGL